MSERAYLTRVTRLLTQKKKASHAAAGESGHYRTQTPSLQTYRVSRVFEE